MATIKRTISKSEADNAKAILSAYYSQKGKENAKKASVATKRYAKKAGIATASGAKTLGNKISKFLTTK